MLSLPYDQVKKDYPDFKLQDIMILKYNILSCKWIARLEIGEQITSLCSYCNMDAGHGGASGRFEAYKKLQWNMHFLYHF